MSTFEEIVQLELVIKGLNTLIVKQATELEQMTKHRNEWRETAYYLEDTPEQHQIARPPPDYLDWED